MQLTDKTFLGDKIKHPDKIINKLNKGKKLTEIFVVVFSEGKNKPEIISSRMFLQKVFREKEYILAALISSEDEAFEYIRCLSHHSVAKYGDINLLDTFKTTTPEQIKEVFYAEND